MRVSSVECIAGFHASGILSGLVTGSKYRMLGRRRTRCVLFRQALGRRSVRLGHSS